MKMALNLYGFVETTTKKFILERAKRKSDTDENIKRLNDRLRSMRSNWQIEQKLIKTAEELSQNIDNEFYMMVINYGNK